MDCAVLFAQEVNDTTVLFAFRWWWYFGRILVVCRQFHGNLCFVWFWLTFLVVGSDVLCLGIEVEVATDIFPVHRHLVQVF